MGGMRWDSQREMVENSAERASWFGGRDELGDTQALFWGPRFSHLVQRLVSYSVLQNRASAANGAIYGRRQKSNHEQKYSSGQDFKFTRHSPSRLLAYTLPNLSVIEEPYPQCAPLPRRAPEKVGSPVPLKNLPVRRELVTLKQSYTPQI